MNSSNTTTDYRYQHQQQPPYYNNNQQGGYMPQQQQQQQQHRHPGGGHAPHNNQSYRGPKNQQQQQQPHHNPNLNPQQPPPQQPPQQQPPQQQQPPLPQQQQQPPQQQPLQQHNKNKQPHQQQQQQPQQQHQQSPIQQRPPQQQPYVDPQSVQQLPPQPLQPMVARPSLANPALMDFPLRTHSAPPALNDLNKWSAGGAVPPPLKHVQHFLPNVAHYPQFGGYPTQAYGPYGPFPQPIPIPDVAYGGQYQSSSPMTISKDRKSHAVEIVDPSTNTAVNTSSPPKSTPPRSTPPQATPPQSTHPTQQTASSTPPAQASATAVATPSVATASSATTPATPTTSPATATATAPATATSPAPAPAKFGFSMGNAHARKKDKPKTDLTPPAAGSTEADKPLTAASSTESTTVSSSTSKPLDTTVETNTPKIEESTSTPTTPAATTSSTSEDTTANDLPVEDKTKTESPQTTNAGVTEPVTPAAEQVEQKKQDIEMEDGELTTQDKTGDDDSAAATPATPAAAEEEEEWEKNQPTEAAASFPQSSKTPLYNSGSGFGTSPSDLIRSSSGTQPFASKSTGNVIRYTKEELMNQSFGQYKNYQQQIQQQFIPQQPPQPALPVNENRWQRTKVEDLSDTDQELRKAKFILNRITAEKFESQAQSLLELGVTRNIDVFTGVITIIFSKAITETKYVTMYTELCKKMFTFERTEKESERQALVDAGTPADQIKEDDFRPKLRTLLLQTCQTEYEKITQLFPTIHEIPDDLTGAERTDFEEKQFIQRKKIYGLINFIAELFKQDMLSDKIIHAILVALMGELNKPQEIKLECFCKLLAPIGSKIVSKKGADTFMMGYYQRMEQLISPQSNLSTRIKFLIQNVLDLKNNGWKSKEVETPKTTSNERTVEDDRKTNNFVKQAPNSKNNMFNAASSFTRPTVKPISGMGGMGGMPGMGGMGSMGGMGGGIKKPAGILQPTMGYDQNKKFSPQQQQQQQHYHPQQQQQQGRPMSSTSTSQTGSHKPAEKKVSWESVSSTVDESLDEYLELKDITEFAENISHDITSTDLYPNVISAIVSKAINSKESGLNALSNLIIDLITKEHLFTKDMLNDGFDLFAETLTDVFEDRPLAYKQIGYICYTLFQCNLLTLPHFTKVLSAQVSSCGSSIAKILKEFVSQFEVEDKAVQSFKENSIDITAFYSKGTSRDTIIESFGDDCQTFVDKYIKA
ncbi:hypothetical protein SAMD00019534_123270 [Acytostelium subglobosum LB1]|uniref:hypothetical protein n=1 Tax=Acytostelium subglobosum LB1 TaxID=1410327 RepID=UPI000644C98E|nr:hypothetical protein SAMD00019534_123270 [Acytostelium subglobosum LB1]GAM29151.1 hypothetical protein SAMD00019534_123270 [Acytostelium subglobosum LB1]|eukprot:XP_012747842.1 hypothetical protein SAMD00019534_123270 [Acytostelium subglobosum LB1]